MPYVETRKLIVAQTNKQPTSVCMLVQHAHQELTSNMSGTNRPRCHHIPTGYRQERGRKGDGALMHGRIMRLRTAARARSPLQ